MAPDPPRREFPELPILTDVPTRRPDRERYGALFYLGVGGLAVVVALVGWFGWNVWAMRSVWADVYALHDANRGEAERVRAAYALAHDPRVNQRQLWDIALRRPLPPLARYVVAEGLTAEAASADPKGYAAAVAYSQGWPAWLRLLLARPLAYRAALGLPVSKEPLSALARGPDRATALWAAYALAEAPDGDPKSADDLRRAAAEGGPEAPLARALLNSLEATRLEPRLQALDGATLWLRRHHPEAAALWAGWRDEGERLVRDR